MEFKKTQSTDTQSKQCSKPKQQLIKKKINWKFIGRSNSKTEEEETEEEEDNSDKDAICPGIKNSFQNNHI